MAWLARATALSAVGGAWLAQLLLPPFARGAWSDAHAALSQQLEAGDFPMDAGQPFSLGLVGEASGRVAQTDGGVAARSRGEVGVGAQVQPHIGSRGTTADAKEDCDFELRRDCETAKEGAKTAAKMVKTSAENAKTAWKNAKKEDQKAYDAEMTWKAVNTARAKTKANNTAQAADVAAVKAWNRGQEARKCQKKTKDQAEIALTCGKKEVEAANKAFAEARAAGPQIKLAELWGRQKGASRPAQWNNKSKKNDKAQAESATVKAKSAATEAIKFVEAWEKQHNDETKRAAVAAASRARSAAIDAVMKATHAEKWGTTKAIEVGGKARKAAEEAMRAAQEAGRRVPQPSAMSKAAQENEEIAPAVRSPTDASVVAGKGMAAMAVGIAREQEQPRGLAAVSREVVELEAFRVELAALLKTGAVKDLNLILQALRDIFAKVLATVHTTKTEVDKEREALRSLNKKAREGNNKFTNVTKRMIPFKRHEKRYKEMVKLHNTLMRRITKVDSGDALEFFRFASACMQASSAGKGDLQTISDAVPAYLRHLKVYGKWSEYRIRELSEGPRISELSKDPADSMTALPEKSTPSEIVKWWTKKYNKLIDELKTKGDLILAHPSYELEKTYASFVGRLRALYVALRKSRAGVETPRPEEKRWMKRAFKKVKNHFNTFLKWCRYDRDASGDDDGGERLKRRSFACHAPALKVSPLFLTAAPGSNAEDEGTERVVAPQGSDEGVLQWDAKDWDAEEGRHTKWQNKLNAITKTITSYETAIKHLEERLSKKGFQKPEWLRKPKWLKRHTSAEQVSVS